MKEIHERKFKFISLLGYISMLSVLLFGYLYLMFVFKIVTNRMQDITDIVVSVLWPIGMILSPIGIVCGFCCYIERKDKISLVGLVLNSVYFLFPFLFLWRVVVGILLIIFIVYKVCIWVFNKHRESSQ